MDDGFLPLSEAPTSDKKPEGQSGLTACIKMGIATAIIGGLCFGFLGALGIYLWQKRSKHDWTLNPFRNAEEGGTSPVQSTDARKSEFAPMVRITRLRPGNSVS
jgi:hypothetical protein